VSRRATPRCPGVDAARRPAVGSAAAPSASRGPGLAADGAGLTRRGNSHGKSEDRRESSPPAANSAVRLAERPGPDPPTAASAAPRADPGRLGPGAEVVAAQEFP
jgi:hypothetical protein